MRASALRGDLDNTANSIGTVQGGISSPNNFYFLDVVDGKGDDINAAALRGIQTLAIEKNDHLIGRHIAEGNLSVPYIDAGEMLQCIADIFTGKFFKIGRSQD